MFIVKSESENLKIKVANLPELLQKEWYAIIRYYSTKNNIVRFEEFKKRYDNFEGPTIEEFLTISNVMYSEWKKFKCINDYDTHFLEIHDKVEVEKSLTQVWNQFKDCWQYDSEESTVMFKEMELLSEKMLYEWRLKYNFESHIYEDYYTTYDEYSKKSKAQLWKEFKEIWEIDISDYNENKYNEMVKYISEIECDSENYFKEYPQNFFEFCENANYHSFDSYSVLEQFEICKDWERCCENSIIE